MCWLGSVPANQGSSRKEDCLHQGLQLVQGWATPSTMMVLCWVTPTQSMFHLGREINEWLEVLVGITMWNLKQNLAEGEFGECSSSWIKFFSWTNTNNHHWSSRKWSCLQKICQFSSLILKGWCLDYHWRFQVACIPEGFRMAVWLVGVNLELGDFR